MSDKKNNKPVPVNKGELAEITGDETFDGLMIGVMKRLEEDRREADDLYERIRQNAEMSPDDPAMGHSAVQALRIKQNVTSQATRLIDVASRYKIQREKMLQNENKGDDEDELLDMLDDDDEEEETTEDNKEEQKEPEKTDDAKSQEAR